MSEQTVEMVDLGGLEPIRLFGARDANLRWIEKRFEVQATLRGGQLAVAGDEARVAPAAGLLRQVIGMLKNGESLNLHDLEYVAGRQGEAAPIAENGGVVAPAEPLHFERRTLYLKSSGQKNYCDAIRKHDVVFGIGPAGTGKTYLAVAMALLGMKDKIVDRIVLVRPAVEAGESLGFLPGTFEDKVDPYLRPLYDALRDLMGHEKLRRFMDSGVIEIAPLAYMRGRTLSNAFVILDEAQNTTTKQMKMFLTRLGPGSKAVITGDVTQIDLQKKQESGLVRIQQILSAVPEIQFCYFEEKDVVRHRLVKSILKAFATHEADEAQAEASGQ